MLHSKKFFLTLFLFIAQLSYAGGWTSGGGELIRDAHNPWFLSNTKEVKYCIKINEKDFGQSKEFVREKIAKAFEFWKMQLGELEYVNYEQLGFGFQLGTQNFYEVSCQHSPDIQFQFAVLDSEQKDRLGNLSTTIAVSVRTDYDKVNLKGKGFVYFNKDNQFSGHPWTRTAGSRVLPILIHEVGHIFGFQHTDEVELMKEDFPEELINEKEFNWTDAFTTSFNEASNYLKTHLFTYNPFSLFEQIGICQSNSIVIPKPSPILIFVEKKQPYDEFFGVEANARCQFSSVKNGIFQIFSGEPNDLLGEAKLEHQNTDDSMWSNNKNILNFWLPEEQKVFCQRNTGLHCDLSSFVNNKMNIASFQPKQYFKGIYKSKNGKIIRPIGIEVWNSGSISKITGFMNGEIYIDLQSGF